MNPLTALEAIPLRSVARHADLIVASFVAAIVGMMIIPVPSMLIDVLLAGNLALAGLVLVAALTADRPLSLSTFPSLLLITTLLRLGLNVSTTRAILSKGSAGEVVQAFGNFVLGGDIVVGLVIFVVVTLVQFLVVAKGAERVAEVGARFTLDAMPGKQMSIDADLRAGAIDDQEAQRRRADLGRESQFYGAMDGAMKFIKGDAIAGLVITALNLIAGLFIGIVRQGRPVGEAIDLYSLLTVGDGLVSQIPALLITLAAGILTTRVRASDSDSGLGARLGAELFSNPKTLALGAGSSVLLALVPGLPAIPCLVIAGTLALGATRLFRAERIRKAESLTAQVAFKAQLDQQLQRAKAQEALADSTAPAVAPIGIDLDPIISQQLGFDDDGAVELVAELIPQLRDALYLETGVRFPGIRVRSHVAQLPAATMAIRIRDVPIAEHSIEGTRALVMAPPAEMARFGVKAKAARHPINGTDVSLVKLSDSQALADAGLTVWSPSGMVALHLARVLRDHATSFIGLQEVGEMLERLERVYPTLVKEVVPKVVPLTQLVEVLRRLVDEQVSIRDLKTILEALAEHATHESDGVALTEFVRAAMSLQISHKFTGLSGRLSVMLLDGPVEDLVRDGITHVPQGSYVALEPSIRRSLLASFERVARPVVASGIRPIVLTSVEIRRYVRKLIEEELPEIAVLSFQELPAQLSVQPLGRISLEDLPEAI